jgi:hypothetical protein
VAVEVVSLVVADRSCGEVSAAAVSEEAGEGSRAAVVISVVAARPVTGRRGRFRFR